MKTGLSVDIEAALGEHVDELHELRRCITKDVSDLEARLRELESELAAAEARVKELEARVAEKERETQAIIARTLNDRARADSCTRRAVEAALAKAAEKVEELSNTYMKDGDRWIRDANGDQRLMAIAPVLEGRRIAELRLSGAPDETHIERAVAAIRSLSPDEILRGLKDE